MPSAEPRPGDRFQDGGDRFPDGTEWGGLLDPDRFPPPVPGAVEPPFIVVAGLV